MESPLSLPPGPAPELGALVREASCALARLDTARLAELAAACEALNRDLPSGGSAQSQAWAAEAREALSDMAVFGRVLEATRSNLRVMERLRELREGRVEYSLRQAVGSSVREGGDGNH
jgi:hypothetical protein